MEKIQQVLGWVFVFIGVVLLLGVTGVIPSLSAVSLGPQGVRISGISAQAAIQLVVGIIFLAAGLKLILLSQDLKK